MLRVRSTDNKVTLLSGKDRFLEICSADGLVAAVLVQDNDGSVVQLEFGSRAAENYAKAYGVKWTKPVVVP